MPSLTPAQCRAARGLLGLSQEALAVAAVVGKSTVKRFEDERNDERSSTRPAMVAAIAGALERAGVVLIDATRIDGVEIRFGVALSKTAPRVG